MRSNSWRAKRWFCPFLFYRKVYRKLSIPISFPIKLETPLRMEDAPDEEDWEGWQKLTAELGDKVQLVGDDLFVTNTECLAKGIEKDESSLCSKVHGWLVFY